MLKIGAHNKLEILRKTSMDLYLAGGGDEDILLPLRNFPYSVEVGDEIDVFIYRDSKGEIVATTLSPKIQLDSFACLEVVAVERIGVFLDMGLEKDLFVPSQEKKYNVRVGDRVIVHMFLDERTERFVGSMKWKKFCFEDAPKFEVNQKVTIMIGEKTNMGRNVLIENAYYGLIYPNEIFEKLEMGEIREAYIKRLREDGDIDVSLQKQGYGHVISSSDKILELLKANHGILEIGDKSSPNKIASITGMSKKTFKKAIGDLYKRKLVLLEKEQVKLKDE